MLSLGKYAGTGETASGTFSVDLLPHGQKDIRLDLPEIPDDGNEYFLNLYAYTKTASGLLPAGYEVAKEQLKLGEGDFFARVPEASGNLEYRVDDGVLVFASGRRVRENRFEERCLVRLRHPGCAPVQEVSGTRFLACSGGQ